jgi:PAS domain S-box-containing protein
LKNEHFTTRLRTWLNKFPIQDPIERRIASLLQVTLIGLIVVIILATLILVSIPSLSAKEKLDVLISDFFGLLVVALPLGLLRRGYFYASALIVISILFITPTLAVIAVFDLPSSGGILFQFTLAIILAGLLISRRALVLTFGLSAVVVGFGALQELSTAPQLVANNVEIAVNFILFNGLIALFIDRFGITLQTALTEALVREGELQSEIAERKQVEESLRESEERFMSLSKAAFEGIMIHDKGVILDANQAFADLFGYQRPEDIIGKNGLEVLPFTPESLERIKSSMGLSSTKSIDITVMRQDGVILQAETQGRDITLKGRTLRVTAMRDITERKQAEQALSESEERHRLFIHHTTEAIYLYDIHTRQVLDANPAFLNLLGYTHEEALHLTLYDIVSHSQENIDTYYEPLLQQGSIVIGERKWQRKDGTSVDVYVTVSQIPQNGGTQAFVLAHDITERKRAEQALSLSKAQLLANLDNTPNVAVQWYDKEGHILYWNPASETMYGWKSIDAMGKTLDQLIHTPEEQAGFMHILADVQETGKPFGPYEAQVRRQNGKTGWVVATTFSIPMNDEQIGFACMDVDITERKQAEEKIRRQNQRLKVLREIDTAILSADSVATIVRVALDHIRELIDCRRASITLIDWETNTAEIFDVKTSSETSIPKGTRVSLTQFQDMLQVLSKDQPVLINDLNALANPSPQLQSFIKDGLHSLCVLPLFSQNNLTGVFSMSSEIPNFFDEEQMSLGREVANQVAIAITQNRLVEVLNQLNANLKQRAHEREKLIEELTTKNTELERFTYTVSHDLKSPLVTIKGFLGYLEQDTISGNVERLKADSKRISNAVEKMQELLNDLLELSRIGRFVNSPESIPFGQLAAAAIELVDGRLKERGVTVQLQPNLPIVYGDRQRLTEVLQNLLDNAAKYMGDQIEPQIEIGQRGVKDDIAIMYVKDNGIGIPVEYQERIFGLFNKLDSRSEGTGIGLALVKRIVEYHGGQIWVESELGNGTTFLFTLPTPK